MAHAPIVYPLRRFLLTRAALLVALTATLVMATVAWFGLAPMARLLAISQFDRASGEVEHVMQQTFVPAQRLLALTPGWLDRREPSLQDPAAFNRVFQPVLTTLPIITSVVAGTPEGRGWLLLRRGEVAWRNRMTDIARWGDRHHEAYDWQGGQPQPEKHILSPHYDPRERPWFSGAMAGAADGEVHWTAPYTFFTTGDVGVTASARYTRADGGHLVVGFDVMLRDLSRVTAQARVGTHGLALVMTSDAKVVALPAAPAGQAPAQWASLTLRPALELPVPAVRAFLQRQGSLPAPAEQAHVLTLDVMGEPWLATARPQRLGQQTWWIVALAPLADFAPDWLPILGAVGVALLLTALLTLLVADHGAHRLIRPMRKLIANSAHIGQSNYALVAPVSSRVVEIKQLAQSQDEMCRLLQQKERALTAQAQELAQRVDDLAHAHNGLRTQNDQLSTIIEHFPGGVSVIDGAQQLIHWNATFLALLELPEALLQDAPVPMSRLFRYYAGRGDYGPGSVDEQVAEHLSLLRVAQPHRFERTTPTGRVIDIRGTPLPSGGFVTTYQDVTAERDHTAAMERLAHFDALTRLPTRVLLADRMRQAMAQCQRASTRMAVAYVDLDGFKRINDAHGHATGDTLLQTLAQRMRGCLRDVDTLARVGGDEFVALMVDVLGTEGALASVQRLLTAARAPITLQGLDLQVSASMGVTFYPQGPEVDAEQLLRQADQAMYRAKKMGKDAYQVFDTQQDMAERGQFQDLARIRAALEGDELVLHYQPKVDMTQGVVIGAEALIRWQHPEQGLLPPAAFLPLIEGHPLSVDVGHWVVEHALSQMASWRALGLVLPVSVNVGALELQDAGWVDFLRAALARHPDVPAHDLQLEVLETRALDDLPAVGQTMARCQALGLRHALDDFGTGYASLSYFKRLPVDELKIDQSFVRDMLDDPDDLAILQGILHLARSLGRAVIAEGVESVAHGRLLIRLGCPQGQGYGIARPMPAADVPAWVAAWQAPVDWRGVLALPTTHHALLSSWVEHHAWVQRLHDRLTGRCTEAPQLDPALCRLGAWLASFDPHDPWYPWAQRVQLVHTQLHARALEMGHTHVAQTPSEPPADWCQLMALSDALGQAIDAWADQLSSAPV